MCHGAVADQVGMLEHKLIERLLADQRLSNLVVVERERVYLELYERKPLARSHGER